MEWKSINYSDEELKKKRADYVQMALEMARKAKSPMPKAAVAPPVVELTEPVKEQENLTVNEEETPIIDENKSVDELLITEEEAETETENDNETITNSETETITEDTLINDEAEENEYIDMSDFAELTEEREEIVIEKEKSDEIPECKVCKEAPADINATVQKHNKTYTRGSKKK